jgi:nifR3 family TIM-barrel protein
VNERRPFDFDAFFRARPVILAPMEDVTDEVFRTICRGRGAELCVTEFVNAEGLVAGTSEATKKITLGEGDAPTAIQIYGADPGRLAEAAEIAARAEPAFLDINCGCWVPKIARTGAGAGWLGEPDAMIEMAKLVVSRASLPVTVKTRIGTGREGTDGMPIVDLARRLEDAGVRAIAIHCRVAKKGHDGKADWSWAQKAHKAVKIPVIVNGDVRSADDAERALTQTRCAGVMIGRRAIEHPWVFREARSKLDGRGIHPRPTHQERVELAREHLLLLRDARGDRAAVRAMRGLYAGYLAGVPDATTVLRRLPALTEITAVLDVLEGILG